ncbi:phospholipid scramblase 3-like [Diadema antillarum]|uniref:phospholipid scramblase 3-like n=1 Tax=Diadema antillarum TaxID=105358 RepID=UPI003A875E88
MDEQDEGQSEKDPLPPPVDQAPTAVSLLQPWIEIPLAGTNEAVHMPTSGRGAANMTYKFSSDAPETVTMGLPAPPVEWMDRPAGVSGCPSGLEYLALVDQVLVHQVVELFERTVIGSVRQTLSPWKVHLDILDHHGNTVLKVRGPCCLCQGVCCTEDVNFEVKTTDLKHNIGVISKQWGGWIREVYTKADNFSMTFPKDLDVRTKATLMAAMFLIEFAYFERKNRRR